MAKTPKGEIVEEPKAQVLTGYKVTATIKPGWRYTGMGDGRLMFVHPDHAPMIVDLNSIEEGDELPRDTDEALSFPPTVGGS